MNCRLVLNRESIADFKCAGHIMVIGPPASGKSTLCRSLSKMLDIRHVQMDELVLTYQNINPAQKSDWKLIINKEIRKGKLITDGFYFFSFSSRLVLADIVIYYKRSIARCFLSAFKRAAFNIIKCTSAHHSTRKTFGTKIWYFLSPTLYWRIIRFYVAYDETILEEILKYDLGNRCYVIKSHKEADRFLAYLGSQL